MTPRLGPPTVMHRALAAGLVALIVLAAPRDDPAAGPMPARPPGSATPVRGMTVSCQSWGWEWGTDQMVESMRTLAALGVNWIAIHPYAGIRPDGSVPISHRWYGDMDWITRPIREAHALGLDIMIKPHIAYWGSPFPWRGAIEFDDEAQWRRFFDDYQTWITRIAQVSRDADAFCVGTELDRTIGREAEWRRIIAAVREQVSPGTRLTYAANWTDYEQVGFWDALDAIGIQAYFPVAESAGVPDPRELDRSWSRLRRTLEAFGERHDRPVVFCELGYARTPMAAVEPWTWREGGEGADETQQRCLDAALRALAGNERLVGAFLWKWFPGETGRGNYIMSEPPIRAVIEGHWGG